MTASQLTVINIFGGFNKGDLITDANMIAAILASDQASSVVPSVAGSGSAAINNASSPYRIVTTAASTVAMTSFNKTLELAFTAPQIVTVSLPPTPQLGQVATIKDGINDAANHNITVVDPAGALIDGQSSLVMNVNGQSNEFAWDGAAWRIR